MVMFSMWRSFFNILMSFYSGFSEWLAKIKS